MWKEVMLTKIFTNVKEETMEKNRCKWLEKENTEVQEVREDRGEEKGMEKVKKKKY
jgi:hypothetical protein